MSSGPIKNTSPKVKVLDPIGETSPKGRALEPIIETSPKGKGLQLLASTVHNEDGGIGRQYQDFVKSSINAPHPVLNSSNVPLNSIPKSSTIASSLPKSSNISSESHQPEPNCNVQTSDSVVKEARVTLSATAKKEVDIDGDVRKQEQAQSTLLYSMSNLLHGIEFKNDQFYLHGVLVQSEIELADIKNEIDRLYNKFDRYSTLLGATEIRYIHAPHTLSTCHTRSHLLVHSLAESKSTSTPLSLRRNSEQSRHDLPQPPLIFHCQVCKNQFPAFTC